MRAAGTELCDLTEGCATFFPEFWKAQRSDPQTNEATDSCRTAWGESGSTRRAKLRHPSKQKENGLNAERDRVLGMVGFAVVQLA